MTAVAPLVDVVVGGVQKGGTTALHGALARHPAVRMPSVRSWATVITLRTGTSSSSAVAAASNAARTRRDSSMPSLRGWPSGTSTTPSTTTCPPCCRAIAAARGSSRLIFSGSRAGSDM